MKSFNKNIQVIFLLHCVGFLNCFGQQTDIIENGIIEVGKKYKFYSNVLEEEREIWVRLPRGYDSGTEYYPVVYQLDGNICFSFRAGLLEELVSKSVPKSILIGLINTDRNRDFTTPSEFEDDKKDFPTAGGADKFIRMFEEDLFPFVNENFRTNEYKTLIGGSLGGLFVIYSLATKPDLFNSYLSIGPALFWDNQSTVDYFKQRLKTIPDMKALLFLTMGNEGDMIGERRNLGIAMMDGLTNLVNMLETESPENLRWGYKINSNERHYSNQIISTIQGFDFFYKDWFVSNPLHEYLQNGLSSFEKRSKRIKYEFGEDWDLSTMQYLYMMTTLNTLEMFSESQKLGLSLLQKEKFHFALIQALGDAFSGLADMENANKYYQEAYKSSPGDPGLNKIIDSLGIDKQSLVPDIKLSTEEFEKLAGEYVNGWNGNIVTISYAKDTISLVSPNGSGKLIPMAKNKAYWINSSTIIEFYFDGDKSKPASYFMLRNRIGEEIKFGRKDL